MAFRPGRRLDRRSSHLDSTENLSNITHGAGVGVGVDVDVNVGICNCDD